MADLQGIQDPVGGTDQDDTSDAIDLETLQERAPGDEAFIEEIHETLRPL